MSSGFLSVLVKHKETAVCRFHVCWEEEGKDFELKTVSFIFTLLRSWLRQNKTIMSQCFLIQEVNSLSSNSNTNMPKVDSMWSVSFHHLVCQVLNLIFSHTLCLNSVIFWSKHCQVFQVRISAHGHVCKASVCNVKMEVGYIDAKWHKKSTQLWMMDHGDCDSAGHKQKICHTGTEWQHCQL